MSERAEELQRQFFNAMQQEGSLPDNKMLALIEAGLAKERAECARSYRSRLELALAQLPEERKRGPHEAGYAEAIEDMIDMLGSTS